jgi:hypothetical protein
MTTRSGAARHAPGHERGVRRQPLNNEPDGCMRDELGRGDVDYLTPFRALGAPVELCEVSRPVSRAAPLVFLAPALCSSGRGLAGNHTSPLTASLASLAVPLVSPDTGGRVPVGGVTGAPVKVGLDGAA